jgi:hypothetical protein
MKKDIATKMAEEGKVLIHVWPDGDWCNQGELEEYLWKSDDYANYFVPEELTPDEIDELIARKVIK